MALQDTDFFLVNRNQESYKMAATALAAYVGGGGASVHVGVDAPEGDPAQGDLWWKSDVGILYVYYIDENTEQWVQAAGGGGGGGGSSVTISDIAPPTPAQGDLWWNTEDGRLYVYYTDNDSSQWVDASPAGEGGTDGIGAGLQEVTDIGNTTDNSIIINDNISLNADGDADFASGKFNIQNTGQTTFAPENDAGKISTTWIGGVNDSVAIYCENKAGNKAWELKADGSAVMRGRVSESINTMHDKGLLFWSSTTADADRYLPGIAWTGSGDPNRARAGICAYSETNIATAFSLSFLTRSAADATPLRYSDEKMRLTAGGNLILGADLSNAAVIELNADGSAWFAGDVTSDGTIGFNLEPDNPANYTTTTDSEGNETQVYNGPTLNVKDRIQNLLTRLDAIEANEVIDDATDSSLLTLLASATTRLDNIESEITSIKARLDAAGI
jgi:hypothetical protein